MAQKKNQKENLPVKVNVDLANGGTITYANEVISTIAGVAAGEVDGVAGMSVTGSIGDIWGRNKNITKGVKAEVGSQEAAIDLYIVVEYGKPIQKVAVEVQENVRKAMEGLTGLHVVKVDVHVQGVSFEMEKKATENLLEATKKPEQNEAAKPEEKPADGDDETDLDGAISEESEFDEAVLEEEAAVDGAEEAAPEENRKPKRPPKARLRS